MGRTLVAVLLLFSANAMGAELVPPAPAPLPIVTETPARPSPRQTMRSAYSDAYDRLEIFNRELDNRRINTGRWGRINATRDENREAMTPSLQLPPLCAW
jgi:hypothetical protein